MELDEAILVTLSFPAILLQMSRGHIVWACSRSGWKCISANGWVVSRVELEFFWVRCLVCSARCFWWVRPSQLLGQHFDIFCSETICLGSRVYNNTLFSTCVCGPFILQCSPQGMQLEEWPANPPLKLRESWCEKKGVHIRKIESSCCSKFWNFNLHCVAFCFGCWTTFVLLNAFRIYMASLQSGYEQKIHHYSIYITTSPKKQIAYSLLFLSYHYKRLTQLLSTTESIGFSHL